MPRKLNINAPKTNGNARDRQQELGVREEKNELTHPPEPLMGRGPPKSGKGTHGDKERTKTKKKEGKGLKARKDETHSRGLERMGKTILRM